MPPPPRVRPTPWKNPPVRAAFTAIIDIDGVVANMGKFTHLIDSPVSKDKDWGTFHRSYGKALPISSGRKLVQVAQDAGLEIAWSTTRPEQFARITWNWLKGHGFPTGPIMFRHFIKDGPRPPVDIKLRHWWWWDEKYGKDNPIAAWFDDEQPAIAALRAHGCPAWQPKEFARAGRKQTPGTALERGPVDLDLLDSKFRASRPQWVVAEEQWQERRSEWWAQEKRRQRRR